jgi:hypothetical protein
MSNFDLCSFCKHFLSSSPGSEKSICSSNNSLLKVHIKGWVSLVCYCYLKGQLVFIYMLILST